MNTHKTKSIIIEDDINSLNFLMSLINRNFKEIEILGVSGTVKESIKLIDKEKPELIFMDIELTDGLSFEVFNEINHTDFEVIFITGHSSFINKAIEHFAFSFITKPIDEKILIKNVNRYLKLKERLFNAHKLTSMTSFLNKDNPFLLVNTGKEHISINLKDIVKCEADGNYTVFTLIKGERIMVNNLLKYYEDLLAQKGFFRAHRTTLINIKHIKSIYKKEYIILSNNDKIAVSYRNRSKLNDLLSLLS